MQSDEVLKELRSIKFALYICIVLLLMIVTKILLFPQATLQNNQFISTLSNEKTTNGWSVARVQDTLNKGNFDAVIKMASRRIEEYPNDAEPYWYRARAYRAIGKYKDALKDLDMAESIAPAWKVKYTEPLRRVINESVNTSFYPKKLHTFSTRYKGLQVGISSLTDVIKVLGMPTKIYNNRQNYKFGQVEVTFSNVNDGINSIIITDKSFIDINGYMIGTPYSVIKENQNIRSIGSGKLTLVESSNGVIYWFENQRVSKIVYSASLSF